MKNEIHYSTIGEDIIKIIPEFASTYKEHLMDHRQILPHVLMGEFVRFTIHVFRMSKQDKHFKKIFESTMKIVEY